MKVLSFTHERCRHLSKEPSKAPDYVKTPNFGIFDVVSY
jgi:hypothetical protein